jgi:CheY-like chemotaxis protein
LCRKNYLKGFDAKKLLFFNDPSTLCEMSTTLVPKVILLADDDPDDAEMFALVLSDIDPTLKLHHVKDGLAVFEHLKHPDNQLPDMIFLDINMPEMNGWQCLSMLKGSTRTKDIPVLIYSTSSHSRDKQTATELGATAFITKPPDYKTLRKILSSVAAGIGNGVKSTTDKLG